jgi:hypothetical protein
MAAYSYSLNVSSQLDVSSLLVSVKSSAAALWVHQIQDINRFQKRAGRDCRLEVHIPPQGVADILHNIDVLFRSRQQNEDTPTQEARTCVEQTLALAGQIAPIPRNSAVVEASEGDILIHWNSLTKGVVLICPKDGQSPSIYRETLNGQVTSWSALKKSASAGDLSDALAWLVQD